MLMKPLSKLSPEGALKQAGAGSDPRWDLQQRKLGTLVLQAVT
jgi:hypothetical protein